MIHIQETNVFQEYLNDLACREAVERSEMRRREVERLRLTMGDLYQTENSDSEY